jgi:hypothetical protein
MGIKIFYVGPGEIESYITKWIEGLREQSFYVEILHTSSALSNGMAMVTLTYSAKKTTVRPGA